MKKTFKLIVLAMLLLTAVCGNAQKHEFRGAWLHIIGQGQFAKMNPDEMKQYLVQQLTDLKKARVNAIIWQIRPQADAGYPSELEPWTQWLSGKAGVAPGENFDPLQFMIDECHKRGMELHAWINPYRVTHGPNDELPSNHVYYQHPEWFLKYADGKLYFDPALPECRNFIDKVVRDIVTRYDVDAIHMDDYFYPYPKGTEEFPDTASWAKYGAGWTDKGDWRRNNVDMLIEQLHNTLQELKPWVQLGISPFGIWRNKKSDPRGSETNGFQCYDGQFADVIKWTEKGWVDYMVPQLYWQMEHKAASDSILMKWWDGVAYNRGMYCGYAVRNTMNYKDTRDSTINSQLSQKLEMMRSLKHTTGLVWWPGYDITRNYKGVADSLVNDEMKTMALPPVYTWIDNKAPEAVKELKTRKTCCETLLTWEAPKTKDGLQQAARYVVYRFAKGEKVDLSNTSAIVDITGQTQYRTRGTAEGTYIYVVTAVDRCNNESAPKQVKVKL